MANEKYFEVRLARSGIGRSESQKATLAGIGLTRFGRTVCLKDTPAIRGMLYKVVHLVHLTSKEGQMPQSKRAIAKAAATSTATRTG
jgi:large subunit ribosomal protein L30